MTIYWTFDEGMHPSSDNLTTLELAKILEGKYSIVKKWEEEMLEEFMAKIYEEMSKYKRLSVPKLRQWLKNHWWLYGVREGLFGGKNTIGGAAHKRSLRSGKAVPFVDTGTYARSFTPEFVFTKEEERILGAFLELNTKPY